VRRFACLFRTAARRGQRALPGVAGLPRRNICGSAAFVLSLVTLAAAPVSRRLQLIWPTPNRAWAEGRPITAFIQPTVSGIADSGCFGCVRSDGFQFHEGLDLKPVRRDRHGDPLDPIYAVLPGVVEHVNLQPAESSYGRYVVLEHRGCTPAVYTLYAHLAKVMPDIRPGATVSQGQVLGIMGHSAGGYSIPLSRAHMHFEMGLMITTDFQRWYDRQHFRHPNAHGVWNGLNLMGFDPLDFYNQWRDRRVDNFQDYFDRMQAEVRLRIVTNQIPDFVRRYPSLLKAPLPAGSVGGWEIACNWTGLPFAWWPLTPAQTAGRPENQVTLLTVDQASVVHHRCKVLVRRRGAGWTVGPELETVLAQLFGIR
jgi:peptidoglycan LD-endopeptidase LytH